MRIITVASCILIVAAAAFAAEEKSPGEKSHIRDCETAEFTVRKQLPDSNHGWDLKADEARKDGGTTVKFDSEGGRAEVGLNAVPSTAHLRGSGWTDVWGFYQHANKIWCLKAILWQEKDPDNFYIEMKYEDGSNDHMVVRMERRK